MNKFAQVSILGSLDLSKAMTIDNIGAEDAFQYALCCRTWFYVVQSFANARIASKVESVVSSAGLFTALKSADTAAEALLAGTFKDAVYRRDALFGLWVEICDAVAKESGCPDTDDWMAVACGIVLRFPKRFTITNTSRNNLDDFLECQNKAHIINTDWTARPGETIMAHVARNMERILEIDLYNDDYDEARYDCLTYDGNRKYYSPLKFLFSWATFTGEASFSDGACYYPNLGIEKTSRIAAYKTHYVCAAGLGSYYFHNELCGNGWEKILSMIGENWPINKISEHKYSALLSAVPKNYKERRMIAPETPVLNMVARKVRRYLFDVINSNGWMPYLNPEDQSINKELARVGSLYSGHKIKRNAYCTIDARHASDSIPRELFFELLRYCDPFTRRLIRFGLADELVYCGRYHYAPQILATSGSPLTPILQSIYYMAIVMTAYDLCGVKYEGIRKRITMFNSSEPRDVTKTPFAIYNDDIIVKQETFDTVVELLEAFGITVNTTKTFSGDNHFRESCGGEYINGYDITGCYWPRKAIETNATGRLKTSSLETLVSLQHKLHEKNAWAASDYLCNVLKNMFPDMSASCVGSDSQDLWEEWRSLYDDATQPHCKIVTQYTKQRELSEELAFGKSALEALSYLGFLLRGPSYASDLDRTLGVTMRDDSYEHCTCRPSETLIVSKPSVRDCW